MSKKDWNPGHRDQPLVSYTAAIAAIRAANGQKPKSGGRDLHTITTMYNLAPLGRIPHRGRHKDVPAVGLHDVVKLCMRLAVNRQRSRMWRQILRAAVPQADWCPQMQHLADEPLGDVQPELALDGPADGQKTAVNGRNCHTCKFGLTEYRHQCPEPKPPTGDCQSYLAQNTKESGKVNLASGGDTTEDAIYCDRCHRDVPTFLVSDGGRRAWLCQQCLDQDAAEQKPGPLTADFGNPVRCAGCGGLFLSGSRVFQAGKGQVRCAACSGHSELDSVGKHLDTQHKQVLAVMGEIRSQLKAMRKEWGDDIRRSREALEAIAGNASEAPFIRHALVSLVEQVQIQQTATRVAIEKSGEQLAEALGNAFSDALFAEFGGDVGESFTSTVDVPEAVPPAAIMPSNGNGKHITITTKRARVEIPTE